jgi:lysyl-tRNA synthetase, class II
MSTAVSRRSAGLWLGVLVVVAAWVVAGPLMTIVAFGITASFSLAEHVARLRGPRPRRIRGVRLDLVSIPVAGLSWALAAAADYAAPAARAIRAARELHPLGGASALALAHTHIAAPWDSVVDLLVGGALVSSLFVARALRRAEPLRDEGSQEAIDRARWIVEQYGEDSLSPFILRPDKRFEFADAAVVAYRVVGDTVVVSGGPVGPDAAAAEAVSRLVRRAHESGLQVAAYGASERHLHAFAAAGLRAIRVGEEAVVDPSRFTLEGRSVRKLRQSVHRVERRGWRITIHEGREIDTELEAAIDAVEAQWRAQRDQLLGFAMSMGEFELGIRPNDIYVLAWSPEHRLQGVMRFLSHGQKLSLDTMRRVGETPNGLNEALVCRALELARARGLREVSLNYAGLGHLVRHDAPTSRLQKALARALLAPLRGRFQMDRLVLFNQKFSPDWRPRYLVYESRAALPRAVFRVLQAEGYLAQGEEARYRSEGAGWRRQRSARIEDGIGG